MSLWSNFRTLLGDKPNQLGMVTYVGDVYYIVDLVGGGNLRVTSTAVFVTSDVVFIKDNVIVSKAPTLPTYTIDV